MKTSKKLFAAGIIAVVIAVVVLYLGSAAKGSSAIVEPIGKDSYKIERVIPHDKMIKLFKKNGGDDIVLNIYPVKRSSGLSKNDFDLAIYYSDSSRENLLGQELKLDTKDFNALSNFYRSYLKEVHKAYDKIPNGYQLSISQKKLGQLKNMVLSVSLEDFEAIVRLDSCRYPPGCAAPTQLKMTSVYDSCRY
ncbi:MAG: hypothetical protein ACOYXT_17195, partial [Bacteroidota bacterium]